MCSSMSASICFDVRSMSERRRLAVGTGLDLVGQCSVASDCHASSAFACASSRSWIRRAGPSIISERCVFADCDDDSSSAVDFLKVAFPLRVDHVVGDTGPSSSVEQVREGHQDPSSTVAASQVAAMGSPSSV